MTYHFERLSNDNFTDLETLFQMTYGDNWDRNELLKKFETDIFDLKYIGFLAYETQTGEPAAYYGVFPLMVQLNGVRLLAVQSGDTMTHPAHRGKGLFVSLAKQTYDLCRQLDVTFVFGYPNKNSYHGLTKSLSWKHVSNMIGWNRFIPTLPLLRIAHFLKLRTHYERIFFSLIRLFFEVRTPQEGTLILQGLQKDNMVIHDEKFTHYKNDCGMLLLYRTACIWVKINADLSIGFVGDKNNGKDLNVGLRILSFLCFLTGIVRLNTYYSPGSMADNFFAKIGFRKESLAFAYLAFEENLDIHKLETVFVDYDTF